MNTYQDVHNHIIGSYAKYLEISSAIRTIKNNPEKYPEFSFFVPGYDAEGWAEKAIDDFDFIVGLDDTPVIFKMLVMRYYRKTAQKWRKAGKNPSPQNEDFMNEVLTEMANVHA